MDRSLQLAHPVNGADANVDLADPEERWRERARCRGLGYELFFPESEEAPEAEEAKAICAECEVAAQCLAYAVAAKEEYGIWGGMTARERRSARRRSRKRKSA
jgi:WhiB family redox-sensing transcriptional regulator